MTVDEAIKLAKETNGLMAVHRQDLFYDLSNTDNYYTSANEIRYFNAENSVIYRSILFAERIDFKL